MIAVGRSSNLNKAVFPEAIFLRLATHEGSAEKGLHSRNGMVALMQIVGSTSWELLRLVLAKRNRFRKLKSSIAEKLLAFRSPVPPLRGARLYCQGSNVRMICHSQNGSPAWSVSSSDLWIRPSKGVRTTTATPAAAAINLSLTLAVNLINVTLDKSTRRPKRSEVVSDSRRGADTSASRGSVRWDWETFVASGGKGAAVSVIRSHFDLVQRT